MFPGDEILPDVPMVYDRKAVIDTHVDHVWPWLVQLGKNRAGWYLPWKLERWLPQRMRALRTICSEYQSLTVGERVPDYGGRNDYLEVVSVHPTQHIVYVTERFGTRFTWAIILTTTGSQSTEVHLRFRGAIRSEGWRRSLIVAFGDFVDWATTRPMLSGLAERARANGRTG
ncbi:MAG TPA: hypothetical protein VEB69_11660 [Acidimicrobiia bacterium]|nr:hypothetical protein [Acidimicrobiia bacterium]